MVRFMFREVVKYGHFKEYKAACKAWNEACVKVGLPAIRYFESGFGHQNEVFGEAEFEDSADIERRFAAAAGANNPEYDAASKAVSAHIVDGMSYTYVLTEVTLD